MNVDRMDWETYVRYLRRSFHLGQHGVLIGSTGSGKSVLAREIVPLLKGNLVLIDGKGGDDPSLAWPSFQMIRTWPPGEERRLVRAFTAEANRQPIRVRLAPKMDRMTQLPDARAMFKRALDDIYTRRRGRVFSVYIDELGAMADPRKMRLGQEVELLLQQLRYRPGSVITAMQFPTWLPKPAFREATHRWVFRVADEDSAKYLGGVLGNSREMRPLVERLPRFHFLHQNIATGRLVVSKVDLRRK